jgi:heat shock protein HslJ
LIELQNKKIEKMMQNPYMMIMNDKVNGNGGCNSFSGDVEIARNNTIIFHELMSTLIACSDKQLNETENLFFDVLKKSDQYLVKSDTLVLSKGRMTPLARFVFDFFGE